MVLSLRIAQSVALAGAAHPAFRRLSKARRGF
jgi:hypothetical protein